MGDATEENYLPGPLLDTGEVRLQHLRLITHLQVIVVTANYRVGPLGFMSLEDDVLPGINSVLSKTLCSSGYKLAVLFDALLFYGLLIQSLHSTFEYSCRFSDSKGR